MHTLPAALLSLLICYVGGPGTPRQAQPVVTQFLQQIERAAGWPAGSAKGAYRDRLPACEEVVAAKKTNLAVVDLPTYLAQRAAWKLEPLAHMGAADAKRYYLLVREGSFKDLAALRGKTLISTLADRPAFLSRVVLGGKVDAAKHFKLKATRRPLKGIRAVARGRADATVIDETAFAHLKELPLPKKLVSLHRSRALPDLTIVALGGRTPKKVREGINKALPRLCTGAGAKLCKTFGVRNFSAAQPALYRELERLYTGKE